MMHAGRPSSAADVTLPSYCSTLPAIGLIPSASPGGTMDVDGEFGLVLPGRDSPANNGPKGLTSRGGFAPELAELTVRSGNDEGVLN